MSLRLKTYLLVGSALLLAAFAVYMVSQAILVGQGQWTNEVLRYAASLVGVMLALGVAISVIIETSLFRRLSRRVTQAQAAACAQSATSADAKLLSDAGADEEERLQAISTTLKELQTRHTDLETAYCQLQQLQEASASLGGSLDLTGALGQLEEVALGIFDADEVWLLRLQADQQQLMGLRGFSNHPEGYIRLPSIFGCWGSEASMSVDASSLLKSIFRGGGPVFIESITEIGRPELERLFDGVVPDLGSFHSLAVIPLLAENHPVGVAVAASVLPTRFSDDRKSTIHLFAGQVAHALENNRVYEEIKALGEIDSLSGLHNRRRALEQLDLEVARARRYEGTFSILLVDIDNFKNFNETWGYPAGDEVIKRVAGVLHSRNRTSDFVGRYGGDEFIMVLPATVRTGAATVADHMRLALGSQPYMAPDGSAIPLRLSFGGASFPEDGHDAQSLIAIADANLYESKRWGGDTVTLRRENLGGEVIDATGFSTLDALVSAVDNKDRYTRNHSAHVAEYAGMIVESLGFSKDKQETLRVAALLHDVGKIGLPDRILRKPGRLTPEEEDAVRQHSLLGSLMVSQHLAGNDEVREAVLHHHERWDGSGYPAQLTGRNISMLGRILAVADAYSAMTTDRPYRAGLPLEVALGELTRGSGSQFDPEVVRVFLTCFDIKPSQQPEAQRREGIRGVAVVLSR